MSKKQKVSAMAFKDASPKLVAKVEGVIAEADKHQLSVSRIYAAYNEVFGLKETPQTCGSCLRTRANKLKAWHQQGTGGLKLVHTTGDAVTAAQIVAKHDVVLGETEAEQLEAIGALIGSGKVSEEEAAILRAKAIELQDAIDVDGDDRVIIFTPEEDGAAYGVATYEDGTHPAIGTYEQDGYRFAVGTDGGHYTALAMGEGQGPDVPQVAEGTTVLTLKEEGAQAIHFVTEDKTPAVKGSKGLVKNADGSNVKTGKHLLADGTTLAVAVGGKAAIKE